MNLELFGIGNSKKKVAKDSNWIKLDSEAERLRELERYKIKTQKTSISSEVIVVNINMIC